MYDYATLQCKDLHDNVCKASLQAEGECFLDPLLRTTQTFYKLMIMAAGVPVYVCVCVGGGGGGGGGLRTVVGELRTCAIDMREMTLCGS